MCSPTPHLRMARCRWFEEVLGDQKLSSDLLLTFMTVDFDIQLRMRTCGHDTFHQFGERLLVHVEDTVQTGGRIAYSVAAQTQGDVPRDMCRGSSLCWNSVLVGVFFANSADELNMRQPGGHLTSCSSSFLST